MTRATTDSATDRPTPSNTPGAGHRDRLDRAEFTRVLEHYETGKVHAVRELPAGSPNAPKAVIECERGALVLKRRAPGLEHASVVGYAHEIILGCLEAGVCVPPLIGTKDSNNSMCQIADRTYELFVFIEGAAYARTPGQSNSTGALLGEMHSAMDTIRTTFQPIQEPAPIEPMRAEHANLGSVDRVAAKRVLEFAAESHTLNAIKPSLVHGDWHPGNMVYRDDEIVAACDFDNTRIGSREREVAQALVYFSMRRAQDERDEPQSQLLTEFWNGYTSTAPQPLNPRLISSLMPAVILDEALAQPNAAPALTSLAMRRALWLDTNSVEIQRSLS